MVTKRISNKKDSGVARVGSVRKHHLYAAVTEREKRRVQAYCDANSLAVSDFLRNLVLRDAKAKEQAIKGANREQTIVITLSQPDYAKLKYKARLRKQTPADFIQASLVSELAKGKEFGGTLRCKYLRYYVNDAERDLVLEHMRSQGYSSRHYVAFLALEAIPSSG